MFYTGAVLYGVFGSPDDVIYKIMSDPSRTLFHEAVFGDMSDDATAGDNVVNALKKLSMFTCTCTMPVVYVYMRC